MLERSCRRCGADDWYAHARGVRCAPCHRRATKGEFAAKSGAEKLWGHAQQRARRMGIDFKITPDHIVIPDVCPALGIPLWHSANFPGPNSPTLDRLIPDWGYVPGNVIVISHKANRIKSDATARELEAVAAWMQSVGLN